MMAAALALNVLAGAAPGALTAAGATGLTMTTFSNSAMTGAPATNTTVPGLQLSVPLSATVGSAEITGTLTFTKETMYAFECDFGPGQMAFVWIRDHLVCHTRPIPFGNTPSSTDGCPEYPLPVKVRRAARSARTWRSETAERGEQRADERARGCEPMMVRRSTRLLS